MWGLKKSLILLTLMTINAVNGITVHCYFEYAGSVWSPLADPYRCVTSSQSLRNSEIAIVEEVVGFHISSNSNHAVNGLDLWQTKCERIPKNFESFFPNIEGMSVASCGLKIISKEDLEVFPKLQHLNMARNQLESLDSNLFEGNPDLTCLIADTNKLRVVGPNLLKSLSKLTSANFESNLCIDKVADGKDQINDLIRQLTLKCFIQKMLQHEQDEVLRKIFIETESSKFNNSCSGSVTKNAENGTLLLERIGKIEYQNAEMAKQIADMSCLKNANIKQALEIDDLQSINNALKEKFHSLKIQFDLVYPLFIKMSETIEE